ncbi:MAG TPA: class I SAM-dependent methyltransferase [Actinomycetaceae bacterium]|nr:class I SAM-dependent methyltransferase [Actinomycetaceae bacterium]
MWDSQAEREHYLTVPDFADDRFLIEMKQRGYIEPGFRVLDVGCGAGAYSAAISRHVLSVVGTDFSQRMIESGTALMAREGVTNVELVWDNWHTLGLEDHGWREAFDVAFVHNSPALSSSGALEKLLDSSHRYFAVSSPSRVKDPVVDRLRAALGMPTQHGTNGNFLYLLNELLLRGYKPELVYEDSQWHTDQPLEIAIPFFAGRLNLTAHEREALLPDIEQHLRSTAMDGRVQGTTTTTIQMIFWEEPRES